jgi:hypothetical protein
VKVKTKPISYGDLIEGIEIDIPVTENTVPKFKHNGLTNVFNQKVTIYNDIPKNAVEDRHFDRFVLDECSIQGGIVHEADGTTSNIVNATTIITKDIEHYKSPLEYASIPVDLRSDYYTVQVGDFVVLAEVDDIVTTASEFQALQNKYKNNGVKVTSVSVNIFGMAVDNVTITNT